MIFWAKLYCHIGRVFKAINMYLILAGLSIIVMVADNNADGPPDRAKMMDVFRRHGMTISAPSPAT